MIEARVIGELFPLYVREQIDTEAILRHQKELTKEEKIKSLVIHPMKPISGVNFELKSCADCACEEPQQPCEACINNRS